MLNLNSILLSSEDPKSLGEFYKKVTQVEPEWKGEDFVGLKIGSGMLFIGPHDKVQGKNNQPERSIFNFETEDVEGEFQRLKEIGAEVIAEPYHPTPSPEMTLATLADPDGNYFQLATPMK